MICPDDVEQEVWDDYLTLRKSKRAPVTATVIKMLRREADKCGKPLQEVLEICCMNGWQGFKAEWVVDSKPTSPIRPQNGAERYQSAMEEMDRREKERRTTIGENNGQDNVTSITGGNKTHFS